MKKRIIVVIGTLDVIGGTERHLLALLPELKARGWDISLVTLFKKGVLAHELEKKGITVSLSLPQSAAKTIEFFPKFIGRYLRVAWVLFSFASKLRKDKIEQSDEQTILHFFLPEPYIVGMLAALMVKFKGPLIMSRRSVNLYQKRRPLGAFVERRLHSKTTLISGNSQAILHDLIQEGANKEHLRLIYNGINVEPYLHENSNSPSPVNTSLRQSLTIPNNAYIMIMVANLLPYKGHMDLLNALSLIQNELPNPWMLLCVGRDDGFMQTLRQLENSLQLTSNIRWLGVRRDIPELLRISDLAILCSHEEGFANAILEAMASALPLVVTNVGGNSEAVLEGETGYVVPPKDPTLLSQAILKVTKNKEKAKMLGDAGRKRTIQKFSLQASVDAYETMYQEVC